MTPNQLFILLEQAQELKAFKAAYTNTIKA